MRFPGRDQRQRDTRYFVAAEDAMRLDEEVAGELEQAVGVVWYERPGSEVDRAARTLCLLRRARAGEKGRPESGDEAVRRALERASAPALLWVASRAISYMDENGFPETIERWLPYEPEGD
jgi:hypothetical protein